MPYGYDDDDNFWGYNNQEPKYDDDSYCLTYRGIDNNYGEKDPDPGICFGQTYCTKTHCPSYYQCQVETKGW